MEHIATTDARIILVHLDKREPVAMFDNDEPLFGRENDSSWIPHGWQSGR
ncbi:hypothetical protein [Sphingobium yanoikuyae]|nr:hypothetical protein [Sphingobium yanoikuyae]